MPSTPSTSTWAILTDWQFWTAVVAVAALIASQFPPILPRVRKGRLSVELFGKASISHFLGSPQVQLLLGIENVGGRSVKITGMRLTAKRGAVAFTMPAINFLERQDSASPSLLATFTLASKQEWNHIVNFITVLDTAQEKARRELISRMRADIVAKREAITREQGRQPDADVDASPELTAQAVNMFDQRFVWQPGEYELLLEILSGDKVAFARKYRTTVWESDSFDLQQHKRAFSKGFGVCLSHPDLGGVLTDVKPT